MEAIVFGFIDDALAATAENFEDGVVRDSLTEEVIVGHGRWRDFRLGGVGSQRIAPRSWFPAQKKNPPSAVKRERGGSRTADVNACGLAPDYQRLEPPWQEAAPLSLKVPAGAPGSS